jgi:hypothetical protein
MNSLMILKYLLRQLLSLSSASLGIMFCIRDPSAFSLKPLPRAVHVPSGGIREDLSLSVFHVYSALL